jgi:hypothetical protein
MPKINQMVAYFYGGFHKWMAYSGKSWKVPLLKMDALGIPPFQETSIY